MKKAVLYWSRRDFRLTDNPALSAALAEAKKDGAFCPVFVLERYMCAGDPAQQFGYPQRVFLSKAVPKFASNFKNFLILKGTAARRIEELCGALTRAGFAPKVYVNEDIYPDFYKQVEKLRARGIEITVLSDQMTVRADLKTGAGTRYSVFTPFKNAAWKEFLEAPVLPKANLAGVAYLDTAVLRLKDILKADENALAKEFSTKRAFIVQGASKHTFDIGEVTSCEASFDGWYDSEAEAQKRFAKYCSTGLHYYADKRDSLAADASGAGTSRMSLALAWGLVSSRYLRKAVQKEFDTSFTDLSPKNIPIHLRAPAQYLSELIWREFYKYIFFHNPSLMDQEFQARLRGKVAWVEELEAVKRFKAWMKGETGYPVVDAAMMQIARTGWMHNRSRMIVSSVLTKNLGVDWRWGQEYFRAQLFDLDEASNNGGWQWGASVGADPKPIRIFNPYLQASNYDPNGEYQKKWLDESKRGKMAPIVEHAEARRDALVRYGLSHSKIGMRKSSYGNQSLF